MSDDLVPHKTMLAKLGLSRTSVWRAMQSNIVGFPTPVVVRRRMHWSDENLSEIAACMKAYVGRREFEKYRRCSALAKKLKQMKGAPTTAKRASRKKGEKISPRRQLDLFGGT